MRAYLNEIPSRVRGGDVSDSGRISRDESVHAFWAEEILFPFRNFRTGFFTETLFE
jgi:hypothetical protein